MNNNTVKVTCYVGTDASKQPFEIEIGSNVNIAEFREAAELKLGLRNSQTYRLLLERDGKHLRILNDYKTFESENVRQGDKLVFILFDNLSELFRVQEATSNSTNFPSLVTYTLQLTIASEGLETKTCEYLIDLEEFYEDNSERFFSDFNGRERQKFEAALREVVPREVKSFEIDKLLREWCEDISLGYRTTPLKI
jgi:hypothetical protein